MTRTREELATDEQRAALERAAADQQPLTEPELFYYQNAGYSYDPNTQTPEEGRRECARLLANAAASAEEHGYSYQWEIDPDIDSSDWCDDPDPWQTWCCIIRDPDGEMCGSLGGIDFGRDGHPDREPYARVIEAELALEQMDAIQEREQEESERQRFIALARDKHRWSDGDIQVDNDARVSFGADGGAYVQAWTWVDDPELLNEEDE